MKQQIDVDVLIVGAGPVGLSCAVLLARLGLNCQVAEKRDGLHAAPQAHIVTGRSMEVFAAAGIDRSALEAASTPVQDFASVLWVHTLTGPELGRLSIAKPARIQKILDAGPHFPANISQHRLEPILFDHAERAGVPVDFGSEWIRMEREGKYVVSTVVDLASGEARKVRSRYLLGCDGASSPVRRALGIRMQGPDCVQAFVNVHFEADLRTLVKDRPAILYWHMDPEAPGTFIAHHIDSTWVYWFPFDPESRSRKDFTEEVCRGLIDQALGTDVNYAIRSIDPWVMTAQVAESFGEDPVFLAGDAAHRFPPTGGLGMNTGIADGFNLAWKLAAVHEGRADARLLASYGRERQPIAQAASSQSLENYRTMDEVVKALDLAPSLSPEAARRAIRAVADDPLHRKRVQDAINAQDVHFDTTGLDQGATYIEGAFVPEAAAHSDTDKHASDYEPTTRPGARLPHAWVERSGTRLSTLDLIDLKTPVLLTAPKAEGWRKAGLELGLCVYVIGEGGDIADPQGDWERVREVSDHGAVLVRPDQHVAWRSVHASDDPVSDLVEALSLSRLVTREYT